MQRYEHAGLSEQRKPHLNLGEYTRRNKTGVCGCGTTFVLRAPNQRKCTPKCDETPKTEQTQKESAA